MIDLFSFINSSPTAHHAASTAARMLTDAGFEELTGGERSLEPGKGYFLRRGSGFLAAFRRGTASLPESGTRITLAHTDSPSLQLKVHGLSETGSLCTVPVEVYGSPILSTWLDRPLEIAGTIAVHGSEGIELYPVRTGKPTAIIPNLAIHLNKEVNEGFSYDKQTHLRPLIDKEVVGDALLESVATLSGIDDRSIVEAELYLVPAEEPTPWGADEAGYFTAARVDNLAGVYANLRGLIEAEAGAAAQVAILFDHEEVGSLSRTGARSSGISALLETLLAAEGGAENSLMPLEETIRRSLLLSNDATHGNHPNFPEKQDPAYLPELGRGPAVKLSAVRRYATEPEATAKLRLVAREADVELQLIQNRADVPAGTTVGPMSATSSLIPTVDLGVPILAMHSARETAHLEDVLTMCRLMRVFYGSSAPGRKSKLF
ncbi:MAG: M18 family aminopeptidase [Spirochaetaceae bacterium]